MTRYSTDFRDLVSLSTVFPNLRQINWFKTDLTPSPPPPPPVSWKDCILTRWSWAGPRWRPWPPPGSRRCSRGRGCRSSSGWYTSTWQIQNYIFQGWVKEGGYFTMNMDMHMNMNTNVNWNRNMNMNMKINRNRNCQTLKEYKVHILKPCNWQF